MRTLRPMLRSCRRGREQVWLRSDFSRDWNTVTYPEVPEGMAAFAPLLWNEFSRCRQRGGTTRGGHLGTSVGSLFQCFTAFLAELIQQALAGMPHIPQRK